MVLCGYGNCQPTTWTREVPVQVFAPTPSGDETVWVKETLTPNGRYGVFPVAFAFVDIVFYLGIIDWQLGDGVHVRKPRLFHYQSPSVDRNHCRALPRIHLASQQLWPKVNRTKHVTQALQPQNADNVRYVKLSV
jgi:hypothetical protein